MDSKVGTQERSNLLDQSEISAYLSAFGDKQVCMREALLLPSVDKVYALLDVNLRSMWEATRGLRKGLPTSKTALKHLSKEAEKCSIRAQEKFIRALPFPRQSAELTKAQIEMGFSVPTITSWLGILELGCSNPAVLNYWKHKLYALSDLSGQVIRSLPNVRDRLKAYDSSEVVAQLGCPVSRQSFSDQLAKLADDELARSKPLAQLMAADALAALLRLAAWLTAESQVASWEVEVQEGTQNVICAAWAIPNWCPTAQSWSNPMQTALEKLAALAGSTKKRPGPVTHLGKLWAAHDGMEAGSRIRLLRNWVQHKGGRPSFQMLRDLVTICFDFHIKERDDLPADVIPAYWEGACMLRFAETMSVIIRDLQRAGWPRELVTSVMDVYAIEYRTARHLMGKPIEN